MTIEDTESITKLFSADDVNKLDSFGVPQLHKAAFKGEFEAAKLLIECAAEVALPSTSI